MQIRKRLWALAAGLLMGSSAFALELPPIPVTATAATGMSGSLVMPAFSLDIDGFEFASLDVTLTYSSTVLTFDLGSSKVTYNGQARAWTSLPSFSSNGNVFGSFDLNPVAVSGPLLLQPAFRIAVGAPLADTTVSIAGSVGEQPLVGERYFDSSTTVTVSAIPEPEMWLLWLAGAGLIAWKRRARLQH
jgi:hypothetical protein